MAAQTISEHLRAAMRLAGRQPQAVEEFANTPETAWFSFLAAFVALPLFLLVMATGAVKEGTEIIQLVADLGPYAVGWLLFPVVMLRVAPAMQCEQYYCRYIAAVNWCAVVEFIVMTGLVVLEAAGLIPEQLARFLFVGLVVWVLTYQHFVAREALRIDGIQAAMLVALRMALDLGIVAVSGLLGG